jgi:hypothetical protein
MTDKGIKILKKAIELSGVDVHKEHYDLYPITTEIQKMIPYKSTREFSRINTTKEIMESIEYMKKEGII